MSEVRTFGGWRERRGFGIAGLSGPQTGGALAAVVASLAVALVRPQVLVWIAIPLGAMFAAVVVRVRGESVAGWLERRLRMLRARRVQQHGRDARMPGALSALQVIETQDAAGRDIGLAWLPGAGVTALVPVEPLGVELVAEEEAESWLLGWSDWLAHLGYLPEVKRVAVTVDTGPGTPISSRGFAGDLAGSVLAELTGPTGEMRTRTVVSMTVAADQRSQMASACSHAVDLVAGVGALGRCGVTVLPAMSPAMVAQWVRQAFDPTLPDVEMTPADMGPTAVQETWSEYRHDSVVSACYAWHEPPGENIAPQTLARLLGPATYPKRVSLVYTPVPAQTAAREVDRQAEAAAFRSEYRRRLGRDETARDRVDLHRARRTAQEQATGAGVVDVSLFAVVSAPSVEELAAVTADLQSRAGESRVRLRRSYGAQEAVFAATLGVGHLPSNRW